MTKPKPSQATPAGRRRPLSETISSLADAHERLDWPHDVVSAMWTLKAQAERVQAVVDAASASGAKIGHLAGALEGEAAAAFIRALSAT